MSNNELRIKQYYPSEPRQTAESSSTLTSAGSPQEDEKPKAPTRNLQEQAFQACQIAICLQGYLSSKNTP